MVVDKLEAEVVAAVNKHAEVAVVAGKLAAEVVTAANAHKATPV